MLTHPRLPSPSDASRNLLSPTHNTGVEIPASARRAAAGHREKSAAAQRAVLARRGRCLEQLLGEIVG
jgi:hypothetical protein